MRFLVLGEAVRLSGSASPSPRATFLYNRTISFTPKNRDRELSLRAEAASQRRSRQRSNPSILHRDCHAPSCLPAGRSGARNDPWIKGLSCLSLFLGPTKYLK